VFSSSRPEWLGRMLTRPTPEQLKTIREQKQFGTFVDGKYPEVLPFKLGDSPQTLGASRVVVASASLQWNDPFGDWRLVLVGDLSRSRSQVELFAVACGAFLLTLLLGAMSFTLWRVRYKQALTSNELQVHADAQTASNVHKSRLAAAGLLLQRAPDIGALAQVFLSESRSLFGAMQGVVYVRDFQNESSMQRVGMAACTNDCPEVLKTGEGLLGQCAADGRMRVIDAQQDPAWVLRSGLGETPPAALLLLPVFLQGALIGAVELGLQEVPDELAKARWLEWAEMLAINLDAQNRKLNTEATLAEKVKEEQAIQSRIAFQQALIDAIPYPMFYKGADTRFKGFNRSYEETFAVDRHDLIGKSVLDLTYLPEASRIAFQAEDENAVATAGTVRRIAQIPYADGIMRETLYSVVGFRNANGEPGGLVGTFIDLSVLCAQIENDQIAREGS
jgi:two-component system C4-dicarboxylate transport sensor histidine kinase DctB